MFFVHGGTYVSGSGALAIYNGTSLALENNVIVYVGACARAPRLRARVCNADAPPPPPVASLSIIASGRWGSPRPRLSARARPGTRRGCTAREPICIPVWAAHATFMRRYGILDQRRALAWAAANAAAFGGDASAVFLFGESAGAGSVSLHLVMPGSWGLFRNAGMESGAFCPWIAQTLESATSNYGALAAAAGCAGSDAAILSCLLGMSWTDVLAAQEQARAAAAARFAARAPRAIHTHTSVRTRASCRARAGERPEWPPVVPRDRRHGAAERPLVPCRRGRLCAARGGAHGLEPRRGLTFHAAAAQYHRCAPSPARRATRAGLCLCGWGGGVAELAAGGAAACRGRVRGVCELLLQGARTHRAVPLPCREVLLPLVGGRCDRGRLGVLVPHAPCGARHLWVHARAHGDTSLRARAR